MNTAVKRKRTKRTLTLPKKTKATTRATKKTTRKTPTGNTLSLAKPEPVQEPKKEPVPLPPSRNSQARKLHKLLKNESSVWKEFKPLQIGIKELMLEQYGDQFSKSVIRVALRLHTRHKKYLNNIIEMDTRYKLNGDKTGTISEKDKEYAKSVIH